MDDVCQFGGYRRSVRVTDEISSGTMGNGWIPGATVVLERNGFCIAGALAVHHHFTNKQGTRWSDVIVASAVVTFVYEQ